MRDAPQLLIESGQQLGGDAAHLHGNGARFQARKRIIGQRGVFLHRLILASRHSNSCQRPASV
jgi:hypothetical protein